MRKLKLLLATLALFGGGSLVQAQTAWSGDITNADGLAFSVQYAFPSNHDVAETWTNASSTTHAFDLKQSLTSVPDGVYELSAQAMYRASLTYGTATNCVLYATVGENTFSTPIANFGDYTAKEDRGQIGTQMQNNNAYLNVVPAVIVEGGNVTIGMKSIGELAYCTNGYWFVFKKSTFTFKNVTETYHAKLIARANTMLATAPASDAKTTLSNALTTYATANLANVKALQAAINTFLETATVDAPLNVTGYITNPSFDDDSGNKKNWIQDLGYKQPNDIYQPTGWNMLYSSAKVDNTQYQTYKTQTDNAKDGNCYYVRQRWGNVYAVVGLHQLVKELPSGAYKLTVAVKGGSSVTDPNTLTMTSGSKTNTTTVSDFDKTNYKDYSVQVNKDNDNDALDISFGWNQQTGNEQLYYVDDFRLYFLGDPVKAKKAELEALQATIDDTYLNAETYTNIVGTERSALSGAKTITAASETVEAYQDVIDDVQDAIDAFVAAKPNYDANAAEVTKATALGVSETIVANYTAGSTTTAATALTNTQNLKVAEYNYVTTNYQYGVALGEWTSSGSNKGANFNNEHWSGETRNYKNQDDSNGQGWNSSSWDMDYNQDVTLPAGNYVFKVAARQASSDKITTSLVVKNGETVLGSVDDFPRNGNTARGIDRNGATKFEGEDSEFAHGGAGFGWEWRYVKFTLNSDATVNIAVKAVATASQMWVSFGDYTLQTDDEANISLIAYNIALNDATTARDNTDYAIVGGKEKADLLAAIAADKGTTAATIDDAKDALVAATTTFTAEATVTAYTRLAAAIAEADVKSVDHAAATAAQTSGTSNAENATSVANALYVTMLAGILPSTYTLGFEDGEYAPYNIAAAKSFYTESNVNEEAVAAATTTALNNAINNCVANDGEVNAFSNGGDFIAGNLNGLGWSNSAWVGEENNYVAVPNNVTLSYGEIVGFEMPLKANTIYKLTFRHASWDGSNKDNGGTVSVLNGEDGLSAIAYQGNPDNYKGNDAGYKTETFFFTTGAAGNYVFKLVGKSGRTTVKNFNLVKATLGDVEDITINETETYTPASKYAKVTFNRTTVEGWNGMVLPFDVTESQFETLKELFEITDDNRVMDFSGISYDANGVTLNFTPATEIKAGRPFMIKLDNASNSYSPTVTQVIMGNNVTVKVPIVLSANGLQDVTFTADGNDNIKYTFKGTYAASTDLTEVNFALINGTKFYYHTAGVNSSSAKAFRAYFENESTEPSAARVSFKFGDKVVTGIDVVESTTANSDAIYNLSGQRVTKAQKGLYIQNGKKVIIK